MKRECICGIWENTVNSVCVCGGGGGGGGGMCMLLRPTVFSEINSRGQG